MIQADIHPTEEDLRQAAAGIDAWPARFRHQMEEAFAGSQSRDFYIGMVAGVARSRTMLRDLHNALASEDDADMALETLQGLAAKQALQKPERDGD